MQSGMLSGPWMGGHMAAIIDGLVQGWVEECRLTAPGQQIDVKFDLTPLGRRQVADWKRRHP